MAGDAYYACRDGSAAPPEQQRRVVTGLRAAARLYALPGAKRPKRRGRSNRYEPKICLWRPVFSEQQFAAAAELLVYGRKHQVRRRKLVCWWRGLLAPVSVVMGTGSGQRPVYLLDPDTAASAQPTRLCYGARPAVEPPYADLNCDGGLGHYLGRTAPGVSRFALLRVTAHTLLRLIAVVPELRAALPQVDEPWGKPLGHLRAGTDQKGGEPTAAGSARAEWEFLASRPGSTRWR